VLLVVLSVRFTDQPQRWAVAPAVFFAVAGLISLLPTGSVVQKVFGWVWPPLLLGLVVWMIILARRQLRSRTRRWIVYPLLTVLALASIGGGYETVGESIDATAYPPPGQLIDVGGYGGLFEDGSEAAVDRLDVLQGGVSKDSDNVLQLDTRKLR
jgi:hypothetical protein